jgi:hypothetical protein
VDNFAFEFFRKKLERIERRMIRMAQTIEDLRAAITVIGEAVDADVAQAQAVVAAIASLKEKIDGLGNADLSAEVQALSEIATKLTTDQAAVQQAVDSVQP